MLDHIYQYYEGRGFFPIVLSSITGLLTTGFLNLMFGFLTTYLNYSILFGDDADNSLGRAIANPKLNIAGLIFFLLFWMFWLYELKAVISHLKSMRKMKVLFHQSLHISETELQTMEWAAVAKKVLSVPRMCIEKPDWNVLDLTNRLLRVDNFLVIMINRRVLDLALPWLPRTRLFTRVTLWVLRHLLMPWIFHNDRRALMTGMAQNDTQLRDRLSSDLQAHLRRWGVVSIVLAPLFFLWRVWSTFLEFGREVRESRDKVTSRVWSTYAEWKFRELNELPCTLNKRLRLASPLARAYVDSFFDEHVVPLARMTAIVAGSMLVVMVIFSTIEDRLLVANILGPFSGIWIIGVLSLVVGVAVACMPSHEHIFDPKGDMAKIRDHTHYMPDSWRGREHTKTVRRQFECLFEYRIVFYLKELLSALILPYTLLASLPRSTNAIVSFFANFTEHVEGVGSVVVYASFDLRRYGDTRYGSPGEAEEILHEPINAEQATANLRRCNQGKMEKSLLSFKANHPNWLPDDETHQEFVETIITGPASKTATPSSYASDPLRASTLGRADPYHADPLLMSLLAPPSQRKDEENLGTPQHPHSQLGQQPLIDSDIDRDSGKSHFDLSLSLSTLLDHNYMMRQRHPGRY